jgi:hypothetical protein
MKIFHRELRNFSRSIRDLEVGNTYNLKINFSWNSIAQEANEIFRKISAQASKMSQIKK